MSDRAARVGSVVAACAVWLAAVGCNETGLIGRLCLDASCRPVQGEAGAPGACEHPPCESAVDAAAPLDTGVPPMPDTCQSEVHLLERTRLDLYLMVDDSGSMVFNWDQTLAGLKQFLTDPASAGIGVGVQFFGTSCDVATYATPRVPIAPLPANATALQAALPTLPLEDSATLPAMQGAVSYARDWALAHPASKVVIVLMTDSLSEECGSSVDSVSAAAREGFEGQPSVQTFVVTFGLGAELAAAVDAFATAGGTSNAVSAAPDRSMGISQALGQVRDSAQSCTFAAGQALPLAAADQSAIEYVASDGKTSSHALVRNCSAGTGFQLDPRSPEILLACPTTCAGLGAGGTLRWSTPCEP